MIQMGLLNFYCKSKPKRRQSAEGYQCPTRLCFPNCKSYWPVFPNRFRLVPRTPRGLAAAINRSTKTVRTTQWIIYAHEPLAEKHDAEPRYSPTIKRVEKLSQVEANANCIFSVFGKKF